MRDLTLAEREVLVFVRDVNAGGYSPTTNDVWRRRQKQGRSQVGRQGAYRLLVNLRDRGCLRSKIVGTGSRWTITHEGEEALGAEPTVKARGSIAISQQGGVFK